MTDHNRMEVHVGEDYIGLIIGDGDMIECPALDEDIARRIADQWNERPFLLRIEGICCDIVAHLPEPHGGRLLEALDDINDMPGRPGFEGLLAAELEVSAAKALPDATAAVEALVDALVTRMEKCGCDGDDEACVDCVSASDALVLAGRKAKR